MNSGILHLLAESEDSTIKIIFGIIVAVIWIVGGIMTAAKKKSSQQEEAPRQDWSHLLRDLTGGQARPWNPNNPPPTLPPPIPHQTPQRQVANRQRMQQPNRPFVQQSPRPFVQRYQPAAPSRPPPKRVIAPKPIQRKPQPQRRQQQANVTLVPDQPHQGGLISDATVAMNRLGGAASVQPTTVTTRSAGPQLTRSQLRKLIVWSEILSPPLALRGNDSMSR